MLRRRLAVSAVLGRVFSTAAEASASSVRRPHLEPPLSQPSGLARACRPGARESTSHTTGLPGAKVAVIAGSVCMDQHTSLSALTGTDGSRHPAAAMAGRTFGTVALLAGCLTVL